MPSTSHFRSTQKQKQQQLQLAGKSAFSGRKKKCIRRILRIRLVQQDVNNLGQARGLSRRVDWIKTFFRDAEMENFLHKIQFGATFALSIFFPPSSDGGLFSMRPPVAGATFPPFLFHWLKCSGVYVLRIFCPSSTPIPAKVAGAAPGQFSCSTNESLSLAAGPHSDGQGRWAGPGLVRAKVVTIMRNEAEKLSSKMQTKTLNAFGQLAKCSFTVLVGGKCCGNFLGPRNFPPFSHFIIFVSLKRRSCFSSSLNCHQNAHTSKAWYNLIFKYI